MKKLFLSLIAIISFQQISIAQQPMTISPGLVVSSPTAGSSGLRFSNLNSGTTVSTTPTKVLSLDASGNVILGNAASGSGGTSTWTSASGTTSTTEKVTIGGFTKLGNETTTTTAGVTKSTPSIKQILLTGTITAALATETSASLTTSVPHGIANWDKIISVDIILKGRVLIPNAPGFFDIAVPIRFSDNRPSPGGTNGFEFTYALGTTNIEIIRNATNSNKLAYPASTNPVLAAYASPYRILITYME
jgi:hypothetical protein